MTFTSPSSFSQLFDAASAFVKEQISQYDSSHDFFHIQRVGKLALTIAKAEGIEDVEKLEIIQLAAMLHDVGDAKYAKTDSSAGELVDAFLTSQNFTKEKIEQVKYIVENVSFKKEIGKKRTTTAPQMEKIPIELAIVQDADRLDAIGAIGIARCMCFSGATGRPIHDPSVAPALTEELRQQYGKDPAKNTALNHFYEKLFLLKTMMKTETGKRMAQKRTEFMEQYVHQFLAEWEGEQ